MSENMRELSQRQITNANSTILQLLLTSEKHIIKCMEYRVNE